jgi:hypothetical protein
MSIDPHRILWNKRSRIGFNSPTHMGRVLYTYTLSMVEISPSKNPLASISIPLTARFHNRLHAAIKPSGMNHGKKI